MFVELHILQNFAPSNLNRDDTGAPKDCEFGGYRRARISSQCLKRAMRTCFGQQRLLPKENLAARTKRLMDELVRQLVARDKPADQARSVVEAALRGVGLGVKTDGKTEYLLFLGAAEIRAVANVCFDNWEALVAVSVGTPLSEAAVQGASRGAKDAKKSGKDAVPPDVRKALEAVLNGGKAADLALFGRMLADRPEKNVDAAAQVAHAISTNRISMEFDFYTAVDDLRPEETAGADMLGTVEFNSACFYRYANVDLQGLKANLGGDEVLACKTLEAFVRASVGAIPTGKQNSMAAQNPPSFVMAVARQSGLWSLANAFVCPVRADGDGDLVQNSISALDVHWAQLTTMYGNKGIAGKWCVALDGSGLRHLKEDRLNNVDQLVDMVLEVAQFGNGEGERV